MNEQHYYTTIGQVYDTLVEFHDTFGQDLFFPEALQILYKRGKLSKTPPQALPYSSGLSRSAFLNYLMSVPISADGYRGRAKTLYEDPHIFETDVFPADRDVFCLLSMPYIPDKLHYHSFFELTYVIEGECEFLFESEKVTLRSGDMCIVSPASGHSVPISTDCIAVSIVVRQSTFDSVFSNLLSRNNLLSLFFRSCLYESQKTNYILLRTGSDDLTFHSLEELIFECFNDADHANACAVSLLNLFLARTLRAASSAITLYDYEGYSGQDFQFPLVLQYIQQNYRTVTLPELASVFHFSETYLSKLIHKRMHQSYTEVLRSVRMYHATTYLTKSSLKIGEIADAIGYDSVDHFTRTFRKIYGMTPKEYRQQTSAEHPV